MRCLHDEDMNVRFHAIEAVGRLRATEATETLLRIAEARDFFLAFPAIQALRQMEDPAIGPQLRGVRAPLGHGAKWPLGQAAPCELTK